MSNADCKYVLTKHSPTHYPTVILLPKVLWPLEKQLDEIDSPDLASLHRIIIYLQMKAVFAKHLTAKAKAKRMQTL